MNRRDGLCMVRGLRREIQEEGHEMKTVLYWKRILGMYWVDWTDVERFCGDRNE